MKVYEALAKAFVEEGTTDVFGMMGDANMFWISALLKHDVNMYECRHEGAGLAMADGWARTTGRPGVVTTTSGPGTAQLATTMIVASRADTPLVAFCGDAVLGDDTAVQGMNQERFANAIECGFVAAPKPEMAFEAVQKAFYLARSESRPIMFSTPMDIQQQAFDDNEEYTPSLELIGNYRQPAAPGLIEEAADLLSASKNTVIIVGRGARSAEVGDLIRNIQERTGAIVATTLQAKNWLRDTVEYHVGISGLYATRTAMELFQEADVVLAVGATLNKYTTEHGYLYPDAKYIQIDQKQRLVMGNGSIADCYISADAKLTLESLDKALESRSVQRTGYHTAEVKGRLATSFDDPEVFDIEADLVDPREACLAIDEEIPSNFPLVLGGGQQICFTTILFTKPREVLANQMFGCIGQGLTTAMGMIVANNNAPAFLVEGDMGFMMHLAEFETACRYNMPLLTVILNDECMGAEYHKAKSKGVNTEMTLVSTPDLGKVAVDLGGRGALVNNIADLRKAVKEFVANPAPTVIDCRISRNAISIPYRRLWFGQDA